MRYFNDERLTSAGVQQSLGEYVESFESDEAQLRADLFRAGDRLFAYVSFAPGYDATTVSVPWLSCLRQRARDLGTGEDLQVVYSGSATLSGSSRLRAAIEVESVA